MSGISAFFRENLIGIVVLGLALGVGGNYIYDTYIKTKTPPKPAASQGGSMSTVARPPRPPATAQETPLVSPTSPSNPPNPARPITRVEPSFDCKFAKRHVEILICSNGIVAQLDQDMANLYYRLRDRSSDPDRLKRDQLRWLTDVQNMCSDLGCLETVYRERIAFFGRQIR